MGNPGQLRGVGIQSRIFLGLAVVHPHLIAAGTLGHDADERRLNRLRIDLPGKGRGEPAVVICRDRLRPIVVH